MAILGCSAGVMLLVACGLFVAYAVVAIKTVAGTPIDPTLLLLGIVFLAGALVLMIVYKGIRVKYARRHRNGA